MASQECAPATPQSSPVLVRAALERILSHSAFASSTTLSRVLRYLVEESLAGNNRQLKEYAIGSQALGRGESFDPRLDPIVRVQVRNLRARLAQYYASDGASDPVRIELPKGTYVPVFQLPEAPAPVTRESRRERHWLAAALVLLAAGALAFTFLEPGRPPAPEPSIAVLPFADLSPARDQQAFSEGLAEELISTLTQAGGLRVTARATAKPEAERVVKGSVRKEGNRVRVNVQVVDVRDGRYLWARSYNRDLTDALAVQEEIARSVLETLRDAPKARAGTSKAASLYLQGRYLYNKQAEGALRRSIEFFEKAAAADRSYAPAYAGLADAWNVLAQFGDVLPREGMQKARSAARKALELDPLLAEAHLSLAAVVEAYDWDFAAAEREYKRAVELNPRLAAAQYWYGMFLRDQGRLEEARAYLERGYQLDPVSLLASSNLACLYMREGRHTEALEIMRKAAELEPGAAKIQLKLAMLYEKLERPDEAREAFARAQALTDSDPHDVAALGAAYASRGRKSEAREMLSRLESLARSRYISSFDLARLHVALGQPDRAVSMLERAYEERSNAIVFLRAGLFDGLRSDPRFTALLRKVEALG